MTSPDRWLLASSAEGSFIGWPVSSTPPHDPGPAQVFAPPDPAAYWPSTWDLGSHVLYGSDVAVGIDPATQHRLILFDYYNQSNDGIAIGCYDWDAGAWLSPAVLPAGTGIVPNSRVLSTRGLGTEGFAFVGATNGFFVVNLATRAVDDHVVTFTGEGLPGPLCGRAVTFIEGIASWQDRVFLSMKDTERTNDDRYGVAAFEFTVDPASGVGSFGPSQICLFDGGSPMMDPWPDHYLTGGTGLQVAQVAEGIVRVYVATENGVLLELEYERVLATESLTPLATWSNGRYFGELFDCPVYLVGEDVGTSSFGPGQPDIHVRVLVSKFTEAWASSKGRPCPPASSRRSRIRSSAGRAGSGEVKSPRTHAP